MDAALFAMSWIGWCIILAAIYAVVVIIRGVVDFIRQMVEDRQDAAALKKWKIEREQQRTHGPHNGG